MNVEEREEFKVKISLKGKVLRKIKYLILFNVLGKVVKC